MDLRREAEIRAARTQQKTGPIRPVKQSSQISLQFTKPRDSFELSSDENPTPEIARRAAIDFHLNGTRARSNTGDFVGPRWVLDDEVQNCATCSVGFIWVNRRHHCRYCGQIFCDQCSSYRCLLPREFGLRDPQRVCGPCNEVLLPFQKILTNDIANHLRFNTVDFASDSCAMRRFMNLPYSATLGSEIRKASYTTRNLFSQNMIQDYSIPISLIHDAKGLAFMTVVKCGFVVAGKVGTGLVVSRFPDGRWSAPTAIGTVGLSWGALIGADITDYIIILNTKDAVEAFSGTGQVSIGAGIDVAIGPLGRSAEADFTLGDAGMAPAYSYSHSRGLYAGVSLDGAIILSRSDVNHRFYGRLLTPMEILRGDVAPPRAAQPLYDALADAASKFPAPRHDKATILGAGGTAIMAAAAVRSRPIVPPSLASISVGGRTQDSTASPRADSTPIRSPMLAGSVFPDTAGSASMFTVPSSGDGSASDGGIRIVAE